MSDNKKWKPYASFTESTVSTSFLTLSAYQERKDPLINHTEITSTSLSSKPNIPHSQTNTPASHPNSTQTKQLYSSNVKYNGGQLHANRQKLTIEQAKPFEGLKRGLYKQQFSRWDSSRGEYKNVAGGQSDRNLQKIMDKINKKEQLINQLRQLTKVSVSDMVKNKPKSTHEFTKEYFSESHKDRQSSEAAKVKLNFRRSVNDYKQSIPSQYSTFHIKIPKETHTNPEQQVSDLRIAKKGYLTHRQGQPKVAVSPILCHNSLQNSIVATKDMSLSTRMGGDSFCKSLAGQDAKNIQQVRLRRNKNNFSYFTTRKTSILDFQILKTLGEGKFGKVYQAIHKATNSIYAIKKIDKHYIKQSMMVEQLVKEIKIQSFCQHSNILQLFAVFDDHTSIYLMLEYMEQGTLFNQLKKRKIFQEQQASVKLKQLSKAVVYLHDHGIAHRDIKPENIVLSNGVAKICDFGWATLCSNERRMTYCGTFDYAAPEILEGIQYDMSVDLWCLGILAFELLVGKAPFYHISRKETMKRIMNVEKDPIQYPNTLTKQAVSFIQSLLKKTPEERMNGVNILLHPFLLKVQQS